jgi:hypothetical protein
LTFFAPAGANTPVSASRVRFAALKGGLCGLCARGSSARPLKWCAGCHGPERWCGAECQRSGWAGVPGEEGGGGCGGGSQQEVWRLSRARALSPMLGVEAAP